jgi:hypothetical protein
VPSGRYAETLHYPPGSISRTLSVAALGGENPACGHITRRSCSAHTYRGAAPPRFFSFHPLVKGRGGVRRKCLSSAILESGGHMRRETQPSAFGSRGRTDNEPLGDKVTRLSSASEVVAAGGTCQSVSCLDTAFDSTISGHGLVCILAREKKKNQIHSR